MIGRNRDDPLAEALALVELGLWVIPVHTVRDGQCTCGSRPNCKPGKHPVGKLVRNGHQDASVDVHQVAEWWQKMPDANIGVACDPSGLLVVDEDPRNGGDETLENFRLSGKKLPPDTASSRTGGDGRHVFMSRPKSVPVKDRVLGPGVDLKVAGYVLAPPSMHLSGKRYEWYAESDPLDGAPFAEPPDWLVDYLSKGVHAGSEQFSPHSSSRLASDIRDAIEWDPALRRLWTMSSPLPGQSDTSASGYRFLLQGQLAARGFDKQAILAASELFSEMNGSHSPSLQTLEREVDDAHRRASSLRKQSRNVAPPGGHIAMFVSAAVEHSMSCNGLSSKARLLLITLARFSYDGETVCVPDVDVAKSLGWRVDAYPTGSRAVRKYRRQLVDAGCVVPMSLAAPNKSPRFRLNLAHQNET